MLYVNDIATVVEFYRRAFGLEVSFFDRVAEFGTLKTDKGSLGIASHHLAEARMPNKYVRHRAASLAASKSHS